jgi:hypothetical protein
MKVKLNIPQGYAFEITGDDGAPLVEACVAEYSFEADVDGLVKAVTNLIEQFTPPRPVWPSPVAEEPDEPNEEPDEVQSDLWALLDQLNLDAGERRALQAKVSEILRARVARG